MCVCVGINVVTVTETNVAIMVDAISSVDFLAVLHYCCIISH